MPCSKQQVRKVEIGDWLYADWITASSAWFHVYLLYGNNSSGEAKSSNGYYQFAQRADGSVMLFGKHTHDRLIFKHYTDFEKKLLDATEHDK